MTALIGAKPVPPATKMIGLSGVLAQIERAERALEAQDLAALELVEELPAEQLRPERGGCAARAARRRRGAVAMREAAPAAVLEQEVDVLARRDTAGARSPAA